MEDGVMIAVTISACEKGEVGKLRGGGLGLPLLGSSHDLGVVVDSVVLAAL